MLYYKDSTGIIMEQTGNLPSSKINKAFETDALLIINGKRVQAIVDISPSSIFKQMIGLLAASLLMFIVIIFCIIYQTKTIFSQHKLNQLRDDFTHALIHDIKTPLGSINTVLSHFRYGTLDNHSEIKERFGKIAMDQVAGLLQLIEKILTIAKMEQKKLTPERTLTDMYTMIKELEDRFSVSTDKQVSIHSSIDIDQDQSIYVDSTLIKDAIANLIDNAIKYSGDPVNINIKCYLRRVNKTKKIKKEEDKLYPLGSYLFDLKGHHLRREDKKTNLTPREAQILQLLYEDKGNVVKRKDILLQFWGTDDFFASRSLDVFINKLRKCLDDDKSVEIITIRGEGLKLAF